MLQLIIGFNISIAAAFRHQCCGMHSVIKISIIHPISGKRSTNLRGTFRLEDKKLLRRRLAAKVLLPFLEIPDLGAIFAACLFELARSFHNERN